LAAAADACAEPVSDAPAGDAGAGSGSDFAVSSVCDDVLAAVCAIPAHIMPALSAASVMAVLRTLLIFHLSLSAGIN
jgi:hypothetical protein